MGLCSLAILWLAYHVLVAVGWFAWGLLRVTVALAMLAGGVAAGGLLLFVVAKGAAAAVCRVRAARRRREAERAASDAGEQTLRSQWRAGAALRTRLDAIVTQSHRILIDTNEWMDPSSHDLLRLFAYAANAAQRPLRMVGPEFEEIVRLKGSAQAGRRANARTAMRLVETLQADGLLTIERLPRDHVRGAYFDLVALRLAEAEWSAGRHVTVITEDVELRVRLRGRSTAACDPSATLLTLLSCGELMPSSACDAAFVEGFKQATRCPASGDVPAVPTTVTL